LIIILLYGTIVVRSLMRLHEERDPFARIAGTGLACAFGVQALINMGVAVRLLPAKGMTLPFVSYGGSSVIASGIAVGMLLALTRARPQGGSATFWDGADECRPPLLPDRRRRHRRPYVSGAGAGRGRCWRMAGGSSCRPMRAARAMPAAFPPEVVREVVSSATTARGGRLAKLAAPFRIGRASGGDPCDAADRPAVVVGFGGYPTIPGMSAAYLLKMPRMIHEQNGVMGRVNAVLCPPRGPRGLRHLADRSARGREGPSIPATRCAARCWMARRLPPIIPPGEYPLNLLVIGGSQGARVLSDQVPGAVAAAARRDARAPARVPSGPRRGRSPRDRSLCRAGITAEVQPFFDDVPRLLAEASW
jgi:hypothetical protein